MKLPTFKGFTLIELLVVITIIAILATIGFSIYSGSTKKATDTQKKSNVEAVAKAYEGKFNSSTGNYAPLTNADFGNGKKPLNGVDVNFVAGPDVAAPTPTVTNRYTVCATLSDNSQYCRSSSQEVAFTLGGTTSPATPTPTVPPNATPTVPGTLPNCNAGGTNCSACGGNIAANTCSNNATQQCVFTTYNGSTSCVQTTGPQTCTINNCSVDYLCISGTCLIPTPTPTNTPTPTPTPPNCNSGASCAACGGAGANTCSTNNGTQNCTYTTYSVGGSCKQVGFAQACTYNNCNANYSCPSGTCIAPNCNSGVTCGACSWNSVPSNTCGTQTGSKACTYTTYSGGGSCNQVAAPSQSCSQPYNACQATNNSSSVSCQNGNTCVLQYSWSSQYNGNQGPIWYYKGWNSTADLTWGANPYRSWEGCCYWYIPGTWSKLAPGDTVSDLSGLNLDLYWIAPVRGNATINVTFADWLWNGTSCGNGFAYNLYSVGSNSVQPINGAILGSKGVGAFDTTTYSFNTTQQFNAGQGYLLGHDAWGDPCGDDNNLQVTVNLTPN